MILTPELRREYDFLFRTCKTRPERVASVESLVDEFVIKYRKRFETVQVRTGVPWFIAALIQLRESGNNFNRHPHNGDPLNARTTHVPAGRPVKGSPPFTWEDSFADLMECQGYNHWFDWSVAGCLYILEGNNGWGYRMWKGIKSPYLWSFSENIYTKGKYASDGVFDPNLVDQQCGVAVLLRRMVERHVVNLAADLVGAIPADLAIFEDLKFMDPDHARVKTLQSDLNEFPGMWLSVDGLAGPKTAAAYHQITGKYLVGDPVGK